VDTVKLLINHGSDPNSKDSYKMTPLFYTRNPEITQLLEHSANTEYRCGDRTAKDYIKYLITSCNDPFLRVSKKMKIFQ
jgi:hypothetical protein